MTTASPCFEVTIADRVAHVVMSRGAEFNTFTPQAWVDLPQIIKDIDRNAKARVIVISSTGKHFTAGMDLAVFQRPDGIVGQKTDPHLRAEKFRADLKTLQEAFTCLDQARMPVIAAVQGGCIGAGVDMVSACDMRFATKDAFFCIQEINIGMTADVGTFPRLCKLMPEGWVRQIAYTGERLPAERAKLLGLVNEVFDTQAAMLDHVMSLAREIASKNPLAVTGSKAMINYARDHSTADALDYIGVWNAGMLSGPHMGEAFKAKAEKRDADFPDLMPLRDKPL
ncbi:MAG: enoyl-CoA hydratase-related protein [Hyphomonadaceae bacterium]|nr:enoyl-CoA hydratase-related protein [Hyphomonadaceae bacterium]